MLSTNIFVSVISLVAAMCHGHTQIPESHESPPSGYSLSNLTWVGKAFKHGSDISITGSSMRNIEAQIREINPKFSWDDQENADSTVSLQNSKTHLTCDPNNIWWAQVFRIEEGIDYLKGIKGRCHMGPGPRVCTRISCSYKSAIWWCNDNDHDIYMDCSLWSQYAQDIVDACQTHDASARVRGQKFNNEQNWNVMVGFDNDHC
ncbi:hypothetical protein F4813DRAFT_398363 [Daldinia decipiens]|uniref:uncharacterized protein n=1 Tax=Daldinia decipiens TaxID=326647 RepID=UPI0020C3FEFD|nr:uncharacterized protein F4813DRAFT_398363 [Daldinia decipiens]KAI1661838.1 hypothetical protein F4813DRAFT_398363 [Daldinia decipiens]